MKFDLKTDNRINGIFKNKNKDILSVYFTAGFPELESTMQIIKALDHAGADMIEVGIPFSDPVADGEVIQRSSQKALENGMTVRILLDQLKDVREVTDVPVIMMGYLNPIYRFGFNNFCQVCEETGIDGLIIPDLPLTEVKKEYGEIMEKYNLSNNMLISPNTTEERVKMIDNLTTGFIYMVSSASTTGMKSGVSGDQIRYFERISRMGLKNPTMVGFGISDRNSFNTACKYGNGAIIGSAFIRYIEESGANNESIGNFIKSIRS